MQGMPPAPDLSGAMQTLTPGELPAPTATGLVQVMPIQSAEGGRARRTTDGRVDEPVIERQPAAHKKTIRHLHSAEPPQENILVVSPAARITLFALDA